MPGRNFTLRLYILVPLSFMNPKQNFLFSNLRIKLRQYFIQLDENVHSCDNNFAFNFTEMRLSKMYQTPLSPRTKPEWIGKYFHTEFSFPLTSQVSVVGLTLMCSFLAITIDLKMRNFVFISRLVLRFLPSAISWKPLIKRKNLAILHFGATQIHEPKAKVPFQ